MRFELDRYGIKIIPENKQDEAYIEDTLGLRHNGDAIPLVRENAIGLGCIAYLSTWTVHPERVRMVQRYEIPDPDLITSPETPSAKKES